MDRNSQRPTRRRAHGYGRRHKQSSDEQRLQEFLAANHHRPDLTIGDIAAGIGVHIRTLQRLVNDIAGQTPSRYLRNFRLEHAAKLLSQEARSITWVAMQVGFKNSAHFATRFREYFGCSPSAYVKQSRSD